MRQRIRKLSLSVVLCLCARVAAAQPLPTPTAAPASPDFLAHYNFQLSAAVLSNEDIRFTWDMHFGGDVDLVDYVAGRANVLIDYEAVLGNEFRRFDPNQGNYTLEGSSSVRVGGTEIAGVFHHVSRHLGDRPKRFAIAWNMLGARALRRVDVAGVQIDGVLTVGKVIQHSFVDYTWTSNLDVMVRRRVHARVGVFAHGLGELFGVDPALAGRDMQRDGRVDVGVRLEGRAGAAELFVGYERRIDAYPLDRIALRWPFLGFRFVAK